jgi:hypothetical protein
MTRDELLLGGLVLAFAIGITVHLAIVVGLLRRRPRWHAVAGLLLPPLGAYWAFVARMRIRASLFVAAAIGYAALRVLALR